MDDEERRRLDRLDYSTDSAERPYGAPDHDDTLLDEHDDRSNFRTGFDPTDTDGETVERDGRVMGKWQWLQQLNQNVRGKFKSTKKRQAERRRDVEILVQSTNEWATQQGNGHDVDARRVLSLLDALAEVEDDYQFGSVPVEVPILAALSLAANEDKWMIRQTDLFDEFISTYIPDDSTADRGEIMRMRQRIREALSTVGDQS